MNSIPAHFKFGPSQIRQISVKYVKFVNPTDGPLFLAWILPPSGSTVPLGLWFSVFFAGAAVTQFSSSLRFVRCCSRYHCLSAGRSFFLSLVHRRSSRDFPSSNCPCFSRLWTSVLFRSHRLGPHQNAHNTCPGIHVFSLPNPSSKVSIFVWIVAGWSRYSS
jgi:hypothetical protein